jgi:[acyl-carrier-protein] S-malonyltransferase
MTGNQMTGNQMTGKVLFQFPGQGSQAVGMGGALADAFPVARAVFDEVNDALGEDLFALMQTGPEEDLRLTRNAQPALFAASMAAVALLKDATGKPVHEMAQFVAGHSLGEYSALAAAGTLAIGDAARLLRLRGDSMQGAVPPGDGAMAAILGADEAIIDEIVVESATEGVIQLANDNAPGQIVVSGAATAVDHAIEAAKARGIRRAIKLPVSAPFHCSMMQPAADAMASALKDAAMNDSAVPVICNVTAAVESNASQLRANLVHQVTGRVRWRETLLAASEAGVTTFVELGTGKVLSGLVKRTLEDMVMVNLDGADDLDSVLAQL